MKLTNDLRRPLVQFLFDRKKKKILRLGMVKTLSPNHSTLLANLMVDPGLLKSNSVVLYADSYDWPRVIEGPVECAFYSDEAKKGDQGDRSL